MTTPTQSTFPQLLSLASSTTLTSYPYNPGPRQRLGRPVISSVKRYLKVSNAILSSTKLRKIASRRKNAAKYDPKKKSMLYTLPPELLRIIYDKLDIPSRVTLSLTSKFFFEMSTKVDTGVTDLPTPVRMHMDCKHLPCVFTNHFSTRRILLLMLKTWMPHGMSLCWVCLKYTKTSASKWRETNQVNLMGLNRIRLPALDALGLKKVRCHADCLRGQTNSFLWSWSAKRAGATGGFDSSQYPKAMLITKSMDELIEYDTGAGES